MGNSRRVRLLAGTEEFVDADGQGIASVLDFWSWSSSDLVGNSLRGVLAEFLVSRALDIDPEVVRVEWDAWDLVTADGIKVEVKSASYWQSWQQTGPSKIRFDIAEHQSWLAETNTYAEKASRPADVYVFSLLGAPDDPEVNPRNLDEWEFHVVSAATIDDAVGSQKTIGLDQLINRLNPRRASFSDLAEAVAAESEITRARQARADAIGAVMDDAPDEVLDYVPDQPPR